MHLGHCKERRGALERALLSIDQNWGQIRLDRRRRCDSVHARSDTAHLRTEEFQVGCGRL
jgi:hypothetical protein